MDKKDKLSGLVKQILGVLGEDLTRDGLLDTPERVAKMLLKLSDNYPENPPKMTMFDNNGGNDLVVLRDIQFSSVCEHHMLPFIGNVHIGYKPDKKLLGLSKFSRVIDYFSSNLQIQERLTLAIANHLQTNLQPEALIVLIEAEHLCMSIRGIKKPGQKTVTSITKPNFNSIDKEEFFKYLRLS